ncbi:15 kDa protein B-like [Saccopteryx leptura]|uniref:15 kDa protein B-like n=1 Tax=Saccopteryx leptura TaxID=249018 RepID=UPI00339C4323
MVFRNIGQQRMSVKGPFQEGTSPVCHQKSLGKAAREAPKRDSKGQWIREGTMAGAWRVLVLVAGLAAMASVAQSQQSHRQIAVQVLETINDGQSQGQPLFRLVEVMPLPSPDPNTKRLQFRIKETVCLAGQRRRQTRPCAFRRGGEERTCTTSFSTSDSAGAQGLSCISNKVAQRNNSATSAVAAASEVDLSQLPPNVREMYEKAKNDIISGILRNF